MTVGLVLASASPRRERLLREAGVEFLRGPVCVDETPPAGLSPAEAVLAVAERKARAAALRNPGQRILAADTEVVLDGALLGKPAGAEEARRMLEGLSGRTHVVVTGVVLLDPGRGGSVERRAVESRVRFRALSPSEILDYARSGEGFDKAGGYGIQGRAGEFVEAVDGPVDNVMGLPMETVLEMLSC